MRSRENEKETRNDGKMGDVIRKVRGIRRRNMHRGKHG